MTQKDVLYNTVNHLSSIKFRINKELLEYLNNSDNNNLKNDLFKGKSALQNKITLKIAETYIDYPIYLPISSDWRGRIYTIPFYITYQGNDLSLSLLEFWDGFPLTESGIENLYVYGANVYNENNISKDSYLNRIK